MSVKYDPATRWIRVTDPTIDRATGRLVLPRATWDRIVAAPQPVMGFEVERPDGVYRMLAGTAGAEVVLTPTTAGLPLQGFRKLPEPEPIGDGPFIYLGVSGDREADAADAARLMGSWGRSPTQVRTGWDVSDEVMGRIRGITRSQMWPYWIRMVQDAPETLVVPVGVDLGRATISVLEKSLAVGHAVFSADTPPRRIVRVSHGRAHPEEA